MNPELTGPRGAVWSGFIMLASMLKSHKCHKLWTEICEINQNFKGDLIKFCEIFTKITLELPPNNQKSFYFNVKNL